jgi:hypothetical protein
MFYYKNNFGPLEHVLQCLFIYNTIIDKYIDKWIVVISENTIKHEFPNAAAPPAPPAPPARPCILFYENSTKFIQNNFTNYSNTNNINSITLMTEINVSTTVAGQISGFILDTREVNYNYILYISNSINYNELMNEIIDPNIDVIINSKISS